MMILPIAWTRFAALILLISLLLAGCAGAGGGRFISPDRDAPIADGTNFARDVASLGARHSPYSGVYIFENPHEALVALVRLIDSAESTLDMRYPGWGKDDMGRFLLARLGLATERGIRVRLLLDAEDAGTQLALLAAYAINPRLEIRLLGPVSDSAASQPHLRHKLLTADNRAAVVDVGGIEMTPRLTALSGDVLVVGPVMPAMARCFFEDWNSRLSQSVTSLYSDPITESTESVVSEFYSAALRGSRIARVSDVNELSFVWGDVAMRGKTLRRDGKACL